MEQLGTSIYESGVLPRSAEDLHLEALSDIRGTGWETLAPEEKSERLKNVDGCLNYLDSLYQLDPSQRPTSVMALSEAIVDVFSTIHKMKPGREGATEEAVIMSAPELNLGGGANVVRGAGLFARDLVMITRVGSQPPYAHELHELLDSLPENVKVKKVADPHNTNAVKVRYVNQEGKVQQVYNYHPSPLKTDVAQTLIGSAQEVLSHFSSNGTLDSAIVISDYGRGVYTPEVAEGLHDILTTTPASRLVIDPRPNGDSLTKYNVRGALLTPNREEAIKLSGVQIEEGNIGAAYEASQSILDKYPEISGAMVTIDKDGSILNMRDDGTYYSPGTIRQEHVINPSGAGDILVATFAIAPSGNFEPQTVLDTAMWLAGTSVAEEGTSTLCPDLIKATKSRVVANI